MPTIAAPAMADTLSSREREVATLVTAGWSNKQIAHQLNVSEGTVRNHLYHIFRKVGVKNRTALAAAIILRHGTEAIGKCLKEQYDALATPVPPHLAALVKKFEDACRRRNQRPKPPRCRWRRHDWHRGRRQGRSRRLYDPGAVVGAHHHPSPMTRRAILRQSRRSAFLPTCARSCAIVRSPS